MPNKDELTQSLKDMTARAEKAEAELAALQENAEPWTGTMPDGEESSDPNAVIEAWKALADEEPEGVEYPLPDGDVTDDAHTAIAAWQEAVPEPVEYELPPRPEDGDEIGAEDNVTDSAAEALDQWTGYASRMSTDLEAVKAELEQARDELKEAHARLAKMRSQVGSMSMSAGEYAALTYDEVSKLIKQGGVNFQVIKDYTFMSQKMKAGRVLRPQHYPQLLSHVKNGLRLIEAD